MNGWMELPNLIMSAGGLMMMLLGLFMVIIIPGIDRWSKHFFIAFFVVLALCSGAYLIDAIVYRYPHMAQADRIAVYLESFLSSILMPMLTVYLLHCCGEDWRRSWLFRTVFAVWAVYFILLDITQFTTFIYYITPDNQYYRGPWYPLLLVPPVLIMVINLIGVLRRRERLSKKYYYAFLIYLIVPMVSMLIQMITYGLLFIGLGMVIAALAMFGMILTDQIEQYVRQQREIAQQRANIMVLQMRPHFIYNTMTSIYFLCDQDPKKAKQVTRDFTTYLRKNFTAVASVDRIPFTEELEHTRAYLNVEKAQYEDRLFVDYDTPHTRFTLPPLTMQPIVENCVKHGMDQDGEPLRITIQTRETERGHEITVSDNGPGYEPADDSTPGIALRNISQRLQMMCGGELTIMPREGGGTVVRVTIPR